MATDIDWVDKMVGWGAAIVAGLFAWLGKQAHTQVKRVDELERSLGRLEGVPTRLENHIEETRKGFTESREHIDVVMTSIKDDIRTLTAAVLDRK
jgi:hypothetical protein